MNNTTKETNREFEARLPTMTTLQEVDLVYGDLEDTWTHENYYYGF